MYYQTSQDPPNIADGLVRKAWEEEGENIKSWYTTSLNDLRFIMRNGEKVLQANYYVKVTFKKSIFRWDFGFGGYKDEDSKYVWLDVPLQDEE